jgi:hypothetical protein
MLRIPDPVSGKWTYLGYYAGAVLPEDVSQEDIERHLRKGMVEKVTGAEAKLATSSAADDEKAKEDTAKLMAEADKAAAKEAAEAAKPAKAAKATG